MATEIYLGNPPQYVIDWIREHSKPVASPKTKITFTDGSSQEYDWSGTINQSTIIGAGLYQDWSWIKNPQTIKIGTNVTEIGYSTFSGCSGLTSVTIPDSVTRIESEAFLGCNDLTSITIGNGVTSIGDMVFSSSGLTSVTIGKDKATVQGMTNYPWGLTSGCVIHCTDGDITI